MEQLNTIKELISQGNVEQAILLLDELLQTDFPQKDEAYYLRGNAYRKQSNWQQALNNYRYAIDLNPDSPARQAYNMVMDILNFYHKDMYNRSRHRALQRLQPVCCGLSAQCNSPHQRGERERV